MAPRICPPPPDCPLYEQRVSYGTDEQLRRAVLRDGNRRRDMAALVSDDIHSVPPAPTSPPTRPGLPAPEALGVPFINSEKGATHD